MSFGGTRRSVNLAFVPDARLGDYVIVHVGFAISVVQEEEALRIYSALGEMQALEDEA